MNRPKKIIITFCIFFNFVFSLSASALKQIKALNKNGIFEKQASVGNVIFNYAEGPDNGPVLLMLHAQLLDWYTYHLVLPELSKNFHVFAVDYPGHGKTVLPTDYEMTANQIGSEEYLQKIQCPVLLIQADFDYLEDGTLNGAMSKEMAEKACQLIPDCQYVKFNCGHVTNLEAPKLFSKTVIDFLGGIK